MDKPVVVTVDDQLFICETLKSILSNKYEVLTFMSGKDAMEYLEERSVDIILLDYDMPGMTGYEVLMSIRSNKYNVKTPVIFITAQTNERMKMEMIERGANDYVCKPINSAILHQKISEQLSKR